jgi:aspartate kinase
MKIIVQKFGGTSVRDEKNRKECFKKINKALEMKSKVIVVVSAMGRKGEPYATDTLLSLSEFIDGKEKDLLLSSGELISASVFMNEYKKNNENVKVGIMTGGEAGIITDNEFNQANILEMKPKNILKMLEEKDIIVIPGFQGRTEEGEVTTLGRGGSDTSAVAIGAAVKADSIEIYSDVNGMMSADPRMVEDAKMIRYITIEDALNLSYYGAKVIDSRALELARKYKVKIILKSTFTNDNGTIISSDIIETKNVEEKKRMFSGIAYKNNLVQYCVKENNMGKQAKFLRNIKESKISLDMINIEKEKMTFIIDKEKERKMDAIIKEEDVIADKRVELSKLTLVGDGIAGIVGVMSTIVNPMYEEGIEIIQTSDSHTTIFVLMNEKDLKQAICKLHKLFFN